MKSKVRFWIALFLIGILGSVVLPGVNAETFDIGKKVSRSDLFQNWYVYESGTIVHIEPGSDQELYDNLSFMFDGDTSTGIDQDTDIHDFDITLYFPERLLVNNITVLPNFGGETTDYYLNVIIGNNRENFVPEWSNITQFYYLNASIDGIRIDLDSGYGNNHLFFNDIIINYTPTLPDFEELQNQIENLNNSISELESENAKLQNEIVNLTSEIEGLQSDIENLTEDEGKEGEDDEGESELDDMFLEPPFVGLLWLILIILIILNLIGLRSRGKGEPTVTPESTEDQPPPLESDESEPLEEKEKVEGRFCPNCGKYTEDKGPFCPHCKRSMI